MQMEYWMIYLMSEYWTPIPASENFLNNALGDCLRSYNAFCNLYSPRDTSLKQQTQVVDSCKLPQASPHVKRHVWRPTKTKASQVWQQEKLTLEQRRSWQSDTRSLHNQYHRVVYDIGEPTVLSIGQ